MNNKMITILILAASTLQLIAQPPTTRQGKLEFQWPTLESIPTANRLDKNLITRFINSLQLDQYTPVRVQDFVFVPLEKGQVYLVASQDFSGREFYYSLGLARPRGDGSFYYRSIRSVEPHFLPREVLDLDGDGTFELLIKDLPLGYGGVETIPLHWVSVYGMRDGDLEDRSRQFKKFYSSEYLASLMDLRLALRSSSDEVAPGERTPRRANLRNVLDYVTLKVKRDVFGQSKAGLQQAIKKWSQSNEYEQQLLAVKTLATIQDEQATRALEGLKQSTHKGVAMMAQTALDSRK